MMRNLHQSGKAGLKLCGSAYSLVVYSSGIIIRICIIRAATKLRTEEQVFNPMFRQIPCKFRAIEMRRPFAERRRANISHGRHLVPRQQTKKRLPTVIRMADAEELRRHERY